MPINRLFVEGRARLTGWEVRRGARNRGRRLPILYLPGILGVKLRDPASGAVVWGDARGLLVRRGARTSFALGDGDELEAHDPLHAFAIVPGLLDTLVTVELRATLRAALGYREGVDLFFLSYDWRRDYRALASRIEAFREQIQRTRGSRQRFIVIGQSAANLAMRYLVRHSPGIRESVAKWYAIGPVWKGTYNALAMARDGYYPGGRRLRGFTPEEIATFPGCFQLLPEDGALIGAGGERSDIDLFDPACWADCGFGPRDLATRWRAYRDRLAEALAVARAHRAAVAGEHHADQSVAQTWFVGNRNRAVVAAARGEGGALVTEREILGARPELAAHTLATGDDHVPLAHVTDHPCGALVASDDAIPLGESYVFIGRPANHRALINDRRILRALTRDVAEASREAA